MWRLYTCRSAVPQKVECALLCAQNSLLDRSRHDEQDASHPHGWGLETYTATADPRYVVLDEVFKIPRTEATVDRASGGPCHARSRCDHLDVRVCPFWGHQPSVQGQQHRVVRDR